MTSQHTQTWLKIGLLVGLSLFLFSRILTGTLYYYISERFLLLVLVGATGFLLLGLGYWTGRRAGPAAGEAGKHEHGHAHDHAHNHAHSQAHGHGPTLTLAAAALIALPIVLGLAVPAQPLGAAAMANREVNIDLSATSNMPAAVRSGATKPAAEKNLLDWFQQLRTTADPVYDLAGQEATVTGFVFRDERFGPDQFMVTRYTVSCCVADASIVGLVVAWPDAAALAQDQWVEVAGEFAPGAFGGQPYPVFVAGTVQPVPVPSQPYLFP